MRKWSLFPFMFLTIGNLMATYSDGLLMHPRHFLLPGQVFVGPFAWFAALEVILLAEHEHDDIRILFKRT